MFGVKNRRGKENKVKLKKEGKEAKERWKSEVRKESRTAREKLDCK